MSSLLNVEQRKVARNTSTSERSQQAEKFDLLFKRNQYLERAYAKVIKQLNDEKESAAGKTMDLQAFHEMKIKCASLQDKYTKTVERLNEYHRKMQQAQGETIGLRRMINGILGHVKAAIARDSRPGTPQLSGSISAYEVLKEENKLLKWKLSVVEGYLTGMFSEEEPEQEK